MKKRKTLAKKTKDKLKWIEENKKNYLYDYDLRDALVKQFNLNSRYAYRLIDLFNGKIENTTPKTQNIITNNGKIFLNETNCYFCKCLSEIVQHHISYNPEKIIYLCSSCHNKIHIIMKEQHELELQRAEKYINNKSFKLF